jgi:hypothetical protein
MTPEILRMLEPRLPEGASIKVLGCGGIGEKVIRYLCVQLSSLNVSCRMVLCDGDAFEPSNAARMFFSKPGNKASVLRGDLLPFVGESLALIAIEEYLTADNAPQMIRENDIVFCCVDNHKSRRLLVEHARHLRNVVVISGGNDGIEIRDEKQRRGTYGTVQIWIRRDNRDVTPDLMRFHPEIRDAADRHPSEKSCGELSAPQLLLTNLAVAGAMLNAFLLLICGQLHYSELCLDIAAGRMQPVLSMDHPEGIGGRRSRGKVRNRTSRKARTCAERA